jgi:Flp pilus assembly protein CpaB
MNNFMISAKRFITNKNTVTIIGVIIILAILYYGYQSTITKAVNPVRVPVAANTIEPQTEVTASDIAFIEVPSISKTTNVLISESQIVGKYTGVNATIPKGSMFYNDVLVNKEDLPGTWLTRLKTDVNGVIDIPYYISVNVVTTYGNSIQPDDYIDVYMKAKDESGLIMFGKLIENIQILAVKDGSGKDVFTSVETTSTPAFLYFGLAEDLHLLMRKAIYLNSIGIEIVVVPHGGVTPITGDVEVSSEFLRDFIDANTVKIPENSEYIDELENKEQ